MAIKIVDVRIWYDDTATASATLVASAGGTGIGSLTGVQTGANLAPLVISTSLK